MQVFRRFLVAALVLVLLSGSALGGVVGPDLLVVTASNSQGSGSFKLPVPPDFGFGSDGTYEWRLPKPVSVFSSANGAQLALINSLTLKLIEDPAVSVSFNVQSGASATDFTITSALLSFPSLVNPPAFATAAVTATDSNNNGATLTGLQSTNKVYRGSYNTSTDWALLINSQVANPDGSVAATDRRPTAGTELIMDMVNSMQGQFGFRLTPMDTASGTSNFEIIPEPSVTLLLALSGVGLLYRRR